MLAEKTACLLDIIVGYVADKFRKLYMHKLFKMEEIEIKPRPVISFSACIVPTLANTTAKRKRN